MESPRDSPPGSPVGAATKRTRELFSIPGYVLEHAMPRPRD